MKTEKPLQIFALCMFVFFLANFFARVFQPSQCSYSDTVRTTSACIEIGLICWAGFLSFKGK